MTIESLVKPMLIIGQPLFCRSFTRSAAGLHQVRETMKMSAALCVRTTVDGAGTSEATAGAEKRKREKETEADCKLPLLRDAQ